MFGLGSGLGLGLEQFRVRVRVRVRARVGVGVGVRVGVRVSVGVMVSAREGLEEVTGITFGDARRHHYFHTLRLESRLGLRLGLR